MNTNALPPGFADLLQFPFVDALYGRRSRRFAVGASIPDGPFAFDSRQPPLPLSELERMLVLTAAAGNTGWHYMLMRHAGYTPHIPNYSAAAGGRTFPSAAGWHTTEIFFTDDSGTYFFPTRDAPALAEPTADGALDLNALLDAHRSRLHKLADSRLYLPAAAIAGHNTWIANCPGSLLIIPVADVAQHLIADLCYGVQNGGCIYDDIHGQPIPGLERFRHLVDVDHPGALSVVEQSVLTECSAELSTSCFAGMLILQAMGLGGWLYDGIDRFAIFGASGDPAVPGLGFQFDQDPRWPIPNVTGLPGVFTAHCPPHFSDMRAVVEAFVQRKFGPGGPFHPDTPGPWRASNKVRSSAQVYTEDFIDCVALMTQYIFDRFGKFPGTVPSLYTLTYLQAHHLDLEFYDQHFQPGAYLSTHAQHMARWHPAGG